MSPRRGLPSFSTAHATESKRGAATHTFTFAANTSVTRWEHPQVLVDYRRVFHMLWRIKRAEWSLASAWRLHTSATHVRVSETLLLCDTSCTTQSAVFSTVACESSMKTTCLSRTAGCPKDDRCDTPLLAFPRRSFCGSRAILGGLNFLPKQKCYHATRDTEPLS